MERAAGIVVVRYFENIPHVLLLRIFKNWDLPKGRIEQNENIFEAALRETFEESGINQLDFCWGKDAVQVSNKNKRKKKIVTLFVAKTEQNPLISRNPITGVYEHHSAEWVLFENAIKIVNPYLSPGISWAFNKVYKVENLSAKLNEQKTKIRTWYETDMQLAMNWAKLNNSIKSFGKIKKINNNYEAEVSLKIPKKDFELMMKSRFGTYIKVV